MDKTTIKQWFSKGKKPTEQQFHSTFDSFWHKDDKIGISDISGLNAKLSGKSDVGHRHTTTDIEGLDTTLEESINSKMNKDGSNYVSSLELVTPVISSSWKIKKQDGTQVSTSTANSITVENGAKVDYSGTSSQPTPSASQTAPTAITGDFGTAASGSKTDTDITANKTFGVTYTAPKSGLEVSGTKVVKASGNQQTSASASVAFSHRRYWGASADADADITTLTSELSNSKAKAIDFNCSGGKYFYYAYPKTLGTATWKVGGLAFTGYQLTEKTIINEYGLPVIYYVYRSAEKQTGSSINAVIS
ncbi:MAG: hypothetical protein ACI4BD_05970 [Paludibacteraceae bacterium]